MVRVLVTGATGSVGPHLAALLLERKHQVFAMARSAPKAADLPAGTQPKRPTINPLLHAMWAGPADWRGFVFFSRC